MKSKTGFLIAICTVISLLLIIWGCGSESNQGSPASKAAKKPAKEVKAQPPAPMSLLDEGNSKLIEATPPVKPGGLGMTVEQQQGLKESAPINPGAVAVTPPIKPGGSGMTAEQLQALQAASAKEKLDPSKIEVIPPSKPGEKGITIKELEKLRAARAQEKVNPDEMEVVPGKPGEKGMSVGQLRAIQSANPPMKKEDIPPAPIFSAPNSGTTKKPN